MRTFIKATFSLVNALVGISLLAFQLILNPNSAAQACDSHAHCSYTVLSDDCWFDYLCCDYHGPFDENKSCYIIIGRCDDGGNTSEWFCGSGTWCYGCSAS